LLAALSWATAEFLAGCAAYGQALYCTPMMIDDCLESPDPAPLPAFSRDRAEVRAKRPVLILISEQAPRLDWSVAAERESARPAQTVEARSRWYSAVVSGMAALLSNILKAQARHQAIMELNAFDDRALRDIGLSRSEIEAVVRCERVERCDRGP
jgi:uncharacterized protein YjiS (DUF1127 family)